MSDTEIGGKARERVLALFHKDLRERVDQDRKHLPSADWVDPLTPAENAELNDLLLLLARPEVWTWDRRRAHMDRLHALKCKVMSPGGALSQAESIEIVDLMAGEARWDASPEGNAFTRLFLLGMKKYRTEGLTGEESAELMTLEAKFPSDQKGSLGIRP